MPEDSLLEYTLPDGAWKDSFDKLCASREILREQNVITKNYQPVLDSSLENSLDSPFSAYRRLTQPKPQPQALFKTPLCIKRPPKKARQKVLAPKKLPAPVIDEAPADQGPRLTTHPFKCSISPVNPWMHEQMPERKSQPSVVHRFQGTPINPNLGVVDFQHEMENNTPLARKKLSLLSSQANSSQLQNEFNEYFRKRALMRKTAFEKRLTKHTERLTKSRKTEPIEKTKKKRSKEKAKSDDEDCVVVEIPSDADGKRSSAKSSLKDNQKPSLAKKRSTKRVCIVIEETLKDVEKTAPASASEEIVIIHDDKEKRKTKSKSKKSSTGVTFRDCDEHSEKSTQKKSLTQKRKRTQGADEEPAAMLRTSKKLSGAPQRRSSREVPQIVVEPSADEKTNDKQASSGELRVSHLAVEVSASSSLLTPNVTLNNHHNQLDVRPVLQPGKWRKTLNVWRRTHHVQGDVRCSGQTKSASFYENSVEFVGISKFMGIRKSIHFKREPALDDHKMRVLQYCNQRKEIAFDELYAAKKMTHCRKIGEGVYGEVFINSVERKGCVTQTVLKVIPIEGSIEVNGETQKTFEQILPEIVISMELCNLRKTPGPSGPLNNTTGFVDVKRVACVKGKYPKHLIRLWEEYDTQKQSENDHPRIFDESQLFVVLELAFSGQDMESFVFANAEQAYYALLQIILTLAVGEETIEFEHRDLHWGNVLLLPTEKSQLTYRLDGHEYSVPTKGAVITIIDYTLSRMAVGGECCHYNDLSTDEDLFSATGDYQFDIYRMMRDVLGNNWESYEPRTNIFWISYIIEKMLSGVKYKSTCSKAHKTYVTKLKQLRRSVMAYKSCTECARDLMAAAAT